MPTSNQRVTNTSRTIFLPCAPELTRESEGNEQSLIHTLTNTSVLVSQSKGASLILTNRLSTPTLMKNKLCNTAVFVRLSWPHRASTFLKLQRKKHYPVIQVISIFVIDSSCERRARWGTFLGSDAVSMPAIILSNKLKD